MFSTRYHDDIKLNQRQRTENTDMQASILNFSCLKKLLYEKKITMTSLHCSWKREIRVKKIENRMKGETWYYTPCGRRMKQFPEIIKVHFTGYKTKASRTLLRY